MSLAGRITPLRLFLAVWLSVVLVTATNITREHYPAFALVDGAGWRCDRYAEFHSDIFKHTDGHWYINNNIGASTLAAVPLFVFSPILDAVERRSVEKIAAVSATGSKIDTSYSTPWPNREKMYRMARERGLDMRFGLATVVLAMFLMAPIAGFVALLLRRWCVDRGLGEDAAAIFGFAFVVATPVLYRAATLNHNMLVAVATIGAWWFVERTPGAFLPTRAQLVLAGACSGAAVLFDYSGVVTALWAGGIVIARSSDVKNRLAGAACFVLGALPPIAIQLFAQAWCFGDPWLPPARWMGATSFSDRGFNGFDVPALDLALANLVDPRFGLLPYAPLLVFGFFPPPKGSWLSRDVWSRGLLLVLGYLVFASANQFARMQWNTGFRYLSPVLFPLWLGAAAHLTTWRPNIRRGVLVLSALHAFVLATSRTRHVVDDWDKVAGGAFRLPVVDTLARTATGKDMSHTLSRLSGGLVSPDAAREFMVSAWPSVIATTLVAWACWHLLRPSRASGARR